MSRPDGARVLVVDDELGILQANLARREFRVDTAQTRQQALRRLRTSAARVRLNGHSNRNACTRSCSWNRFGASTCVDARGEEVPSRAPVGGADSQSGRLHESRGLPAATVRLREALVAEAVSSVRVIIYIGVIAAGLRSEASDEPLHPERANAVRLRRK